MSKRGIEILCESNPSEARACKNSGVKHTENWMVAKADKKYLVYPDTGEKEFARLLTYQNGNSECMNFKKRKIDEQKRQLAVPGKDILQVWDQDEQEFVNVMSWRKRK